MCFILFVLFVPFSRHRLVPLPQLPSCAMPSLEPTAVSTGFQTANIIKFPHSAFFSLHFSLPRPLSSPNAGQNRTLRRIGFPTTQVRISGLYRWTRRLAVPGIAKIPQHGSRISSFASKPHGSRSASRKPREKKIGNIGQPQAEITTTINASSS